MAKSDEEPNRAAMPQCRERQSVGLSLSLRGTDTLPDSFILGYKSANAVVIQAMVNALLRGIKPYPISAQFSAIHR